jgi:hypothetical protein
VSWADWITRLRGGKPGLDVYAFGKHPAWPDFIDVARLPPVPASFRHFHDVLRPGVDAVYSDEPAVPRLLLWTARGRSGVVGVWPSRDGGNPRTGQFRRSPLLLGIAAAMPLGPLLEFGGTKLMSLASAVSDPGLPADAVLTAITTAAADWRTAFARVTPPPPTPDRPPPAGVLPAAEHHADLSRRAGDAVAHFVTDRSPTVLLVAGAPGGLFVARCDWYRLDAQTVRDALEEVGHAD